MKFLKHPWFIVCGCIVFVLAVCIVALSISAEKVARSEFVAPNTWVASVRLDNMTTLGATNAVSAYYGNFAKNRSITLSAGNITKSIPLDLVGVKVNIEKTVQTAMDIGKIENWVQRIFLAGRRPFIRTMLPLCIEMDTTLLRAKIQEFANAVEQENTVYIMDMEAQRLTVNRDNAEMLVNVEATLNSAVSAICSGSPESAKTVTAGKVSSGKLAELIHSRLACEPEDATVKSEDGKVVFVKEKDGISFDVAELKSAMEHNSGSVTVPIVTTKAKVDEEALKATLFQDVLAEYTTKYSTADGNRTKNIRTAANNVNGTILLQDQSFSFNETVGERTFAAGFAMAHVYSGGRIIDGVGGGICQVSTTLYSAALYADLEVLERHNHSFTIGYAPLGQDATVSYGALDFVFKNNTGYPLQIETINGVGTLTVRILGTQTDADREIEMVHTTIGVKPFPVVEKPNPDASATRAIVEQAGMTGYTVDSYKVYKRNGVEEKREFLHRSVYQTLPKIMLMPQSEQEPMVEEEVVLDEGSI